MFKSTKEFDGAVKDILVYIRDGRDIKQLRQKHGEDNFNQAYERCYNEGLLDGITAGGRTNDGLMHYDGQPKISYAGLRFIENG